VTEFDTPRGLGRYDLVEPATAATSLMVLGHGAGGGVDAPDIVAVRDAVRDHGVAVARVTQPYRVAGKRAPAPAAALDEAWVAAVVRLRTGNLGRIPLIVGGRSSGARVACRTANEVGASAIVALAFPLHPPGRPERSRASELDTGVPTLVLNGDKDPFGVPEPAKGIDVYVRPGAKHDLRAGLAGTSALVVEWLCRMGLAT
jgi:uncharacterized protein